ncbi:MAG: hypothetical protein QF471_05390, partial [Phycisphaerales bacterium]|nr:hypothetical protein [Phycisphaerales bacterium]
DEWISVRSIETGPGDAAMLPNMPGTVYYPWPSHDITDIMLTFEVSEDVVVGRDWGVRSIRRGLDIDGEYTVSIFDFDRSRPDWRDFQPDVLPQVDPGEWDEFIAQPYPGTPPGIGRYLERQADDTLRMYVRILTHGDVNEPYQWDLDFVDIADLYNPGP